MCSKIVSYKQRECVLTVIPHDNIYDIKEKEKRQLIKSMFLRSRESELLVQLFYYSLMSSPDHRVNSESESSPSPSQVTESVVF